MKRIALKEPTRVFGKHPDPDPRLYQILAHLEAGAKVEIGDPVLVVYDHRDQHALPFDYKGETFYFLAAEAQYEIMVN
jgi:hypothetical protein